MIPVAHFLILFVILVAVQAGSPEGTSSHTADTCYPLVGCFSNLLPWTTPNRPALPPQHPANVTTGMYFYSREYPNGIRFSIFPQINSSGIPLDGNKTTFMIFYGFEGNISSPWVVKLKDALLRQLDSEILIADYNMANQSYEQSAGNIRIITKLSLLVIDTFGLEASNLHLIGFCCGSHISGYIGKSLKESGFKLARITALEPRKRLFLWQDPAVRLMPDDANFIDVIHTDVTAPKMSPPTGHIDYYFQKNNQQATKSNENPLAHDYFIESIENNNCLLGQPAKIEWDKDGKPLGVIVTQSCQNESCAIVGMDAIKSTARGVFAVFPSPIPPYCVPKGGEYF